MMKAMFDTRLCAEPEALYELLYAPDVRRQWDTSIGAYTEIEKEAEDTVQYYMHNKAPWPFSDRDFVETRFIRRRENGDMEICFKASQHSEYPEREKIVRGETIIGGQMFRKRRTGNGEMRLMITTILQADMKGEIPKKMIKVTLPTSFMKWFRTIKKELQKRYGYTEVQ
jgi:hypothetical protein